MEHFTLHCQSSGKGQPSRLILIEYTAANFAEGHNLESTIHRNSKRGLYAIIASTVKSTKKEKSLLLDSIGIHFRPNSSELEEKIVPIDVEF